MEHKAAPAHYHEPSISRDELLCDGKRGEKLGFWGHVEWAGFGWPARLRPGLAEPSLAAGGTPGLRGAAAQGCLSPCQLGARGSRPGAAGALGRRAEHKGDELPASCSWCQGSAPAVGRQKIPPPASFPCLPLVFVPSFFPLFPSLLFPFSSEEQNIPKFCKNTGALCWLLRWEGGQEVFNSIFPRKTLGCCPWGKQDTHKSIFYVFK